MMERADGTHRAPSMDSTRRAWGVATHVLVALALAACQQEAAVSARRSSQPLDPAATSETRRALTVLAGPEGGSYHRAAQDLAEVLKEEGEGGTELRIQLTPGSYANLEQLARGQADLAFVQYDTILAFNGMGPKGRGLVDRTVAVAPVGQELVHVIRRRRSRVAGFEDFIAKRVGVGPERSGSWISAWTIAFHVGSLDLDEVDTTARLPYPQALESLVNGDLDVQVITTAPGMPLLRELPSSLARHLEMMSLPDDYQVPEPLAAAYVVATLPARTYPFQSKPVTALATRFHLLAHRDAPPELARMVERLFAQAGRLRAAGRWPHLGPQRVRDDVALGIPYHHATLKHLGLEPVPE